jgi:hypothetical protein
MLRVQFIQQLSHSQLDEKLSEYSIIGDNPELESKSFALTILLIKVGCALDGNKIIPSLIQKSVSNKTI